MNGSLEGISFDINEISKTNDKVKYNVLIKVPLSMGWIDLVRFTVDSKSKMKVFNLNHIKNDQEYAYFMSNIELETKGIYHYYFSFDINHKFTYFKKKNNTNNQTITDEEKWKLSVNFDTPSWAKGKIMYHIFVDRFNKSDNSNLIPMKNRTIHSSWDEDILIGPNENGEWCTDFYGGNLKGIINKLDYIKSLGASIIYLSPIMRSQSNHRYDTSDYEIVDPYAGSNEDLKELCKEAHKKGINIILDAVFNHTGNDSKYFNQYGNFDTLGAYQSDKSPYYNFYRKHVVNGTTYFDYWWGMKNLPVCDGSSKDWQNYIYGENGIIDKWFSMGIDGLRLDVADELSDEFIMNIRSAVKRNKEDGLILGEVWKNPMRMRRSYIESGKSMDSVMNYVLVDALIRYFKYADTLSLNEVTKQIINEYPDPSIYTLMNFTSTHDISRAINLFSTNDFKTYNSWAWDTYIEDRELQKMFKLSKEQYEYGKKIYKSYVYTLNFYPGILSIFYGDEVGLLGLGNLANRRPFPWGKEDKDLLEFFKNIGSIRNKEKFLETAALNIVDINDKSLIFERNSDLNDALIIVNRSDDVIKTPIIEKYINANPCYPLGISNTENIDSHGGLVLKKKV